VSSSVIPDAGAFEMGDGPVGILLLHGFTGNPFGLRPLAESLAARGHTVVCPLLPGHGTKWEDLGTIAWQDWLTEAERALDDVERRCPEGLVVTGVSMGGALALLLAARHPGRIRGVAVVNAYVRDPRLAVFPVARLLIRSVKGIGNDISKPGGDERPYERIPARGLWELSKFLKVVHKELPNVRTPLLVLNSSQDHVVPKGNSRYVLSRAASPSKELVELPSSFHVAWLDHDAELIFRRIGEFVSAQTQA
jgi:carboxylesterase